MIQGPHCLFQDDHELLRSLMDNRVPVLDKTDFSVRWEEAETVEDREYIARYFQQRVKA